MNLYLLSQNVNDGYDTYDSCVVAAESSDEARTITPSSGYKSSWCSPDEVVVKFIGNAAEGVKAGIVLASFNAG